MSPCRFSLFCQSYIITLPVAAIVCQFDIINLKIIRPPDLPVRSPTNSKGRKTLSTTRRRSIPTRKASCTTSRIVPTTPSSHSDALVSSRAAALAARDGHRSWHQLSEEQRMPFTSAARQQLADVLQRIEATQ
jgi:hypothetical protein